MIKENCQIPEFISLKLKINLSPFFFFSCRKWFIQFVIRMVPFCASWYSRRMAFKRWSSLTRLNQPPEHVIIWMDVTSTRLAVHSKLITQRWDLIFLTQSYRFNDMQLIKSEKTSKFRHAFIMLILILWHTSIVKKYLEVFQFCRCRCQEGNWNSFNSFYLW